jgi:hypothetical protein
MIEVIIDVRSGVAEVAQLPPGVKVIIRDYDVEGFEAYCERDPEGNACCISDYVKEE